VRESLAAVSMLAKKSAMTVLVTTVRSWMQLAVGAERREKRFGVESERRFSVSLKARSLGLGDLDAIRLVKGSSNQFVHFFRLTNRISGLLTAVSTNAKNRVIHHRRNQPPARVHHPRLLTALAANAASHPQK